jgi:hypothetical protein
MATKLNVNTGGDDIGKKLWDRHQKNEFTRVNHYKEAVCLNCLKKDVAAATIATICGDCAGKRGREALLTTVSYKHYGLCLFCGLHKFALEEINARFCMSCHRKIADVTKKYNTSGGMMGNDPFWKHLRKKYGKDFQEKFKQGWAQRARD